MSSRPSTFPLTAPGGVRLYSTNELINMPPPEWLIEPIMTEQGLTALYAPPESLKSFVALDMALCVSAGLPWQEYPVQRKGFVVYISAEGGAGIGKRIHAWLLVHQLAPTDVDIAWLIESIPVTADSDQMCRLMDRLDTEVRREPSLIVVDTLARCFDGDENQQEDMNRFVQGIDRLRAAYQCAVLVVHHTRLDGERERGNTAFRGAADTMLALRRTDDLVEISCAKQKDDAHFATFALEKTVVEWEEAKDDGVRTVSSCVLERTQAPARHAAKVAAVVHVLAQVGPCSWDAWVAATGLTPSGFQKMFHAVKRQGLAEKVNGLWQAKPVDREG